jgi:hypothetical protein
MRLQNHPLSPRSNDLKDSEIPKYIGKLRRFLGYEALAKAQADLDKDLSHHGGCYRIWAQHLKPWLFAFRNYDQITNNGIHTPSAWPTDIRKLAGDALMIASLHRSMPEEVREKYRKDFLLSQHNDFILEIFSAWHYYLDGYDIQWYRLGHTKCPEFRVQGGGLDFDVECRRFGLDMSENVKTPVMADACDAIYTRLLPHNLWGEVKVLFSDHFVFDPSCTSQWSETLAHALGLRHTTIQLDPYVQLILELKPAPSRTYTPNELVDLTQDKHPSERSYLQSKRTGELGFDPIVFRCCGPRKTPTELRDYIYKTLKEKVTMQLIPNRAGVIIVRFTGLHDPSVFNESDGIQEALDKLFKQPHLAAVTLQCDEVAEADGENTLYTTPSALFRNPMTAFPQVAAAKHLS